MRHAHDGKEYSHIDQVVTFVENMHAAITQEVSDSIKSTF